MGRPSRPQGPNRNDRRRIHSDNRPRFQPEQVLLEERVMPASISFEAGLLTFTAAAAETNNITIETRSGSLAIREDGTDVSVSISGDDISANPENPREALIDAALVNEIEITTGNEEDAGTESDAVTFFDVPGLDKSVTLNGGNGTDQLFIDGTSGNDNISLSRLRRLDGLKVVVVEHSGAPFQFQSLEVITIDLSEDGTDTVFVDRHISGIDRPLSLNLIGGGQGSDDLLVENDGEISQDIRVTPSNLQFEDVIETDHLFLGRSDNVAIDQPKVAVEVIEEIEGQEATSLGPQAFNTLLLDTGATGLLFAAPPTGEMIRLGYETEGTYFEQGVAGFTQMDVSKEYRLDFAGVSGIRQTLRDQRLLSSTTLEFSFFGPWGIIGMPAMAGRVTEIDMSGWSNIEDVADLSIKTEFMDELPEDSGRYRTVPLELFDFPADGQNGDDPIPTFAPLPFLPVTLRDDGHVHNGEFLLDTGAQLSIISTQAAIDMGLDKDGNGSLEEEALDYIEVGGIGGTATIPLLAFDQIAIPTLEGEELIFTELVAGVLDIEVEDGPEIGGVFGMDFLTSGWANKVLPLLLGDTEAAEKDGYFSHVYFDFRDYESGHGTMVLNVTEDRDFVGDPATNTLTIAHQGLDQVEINSGDGTDSFVVSPSTSTIFDLDGADPTDDSLVLSPSDLPADIDVVNGIITIDGFEPILFDNIESFSDSNIDTTRPTVAINDVAPNPRGKSVPEIEIVFSEEVGWLTLDDFTLTRDGVEVPLDSAKVYSLDDIVWTLGRLETLTSEPGDYILTLRADGSGIEDLAGNLLNTDATVSWTKFNAPDPSKIDGGVVQVDSTGLWVGVELDYDYLQPVVIATPSYGANGQPLITRIRHAEGARFELMVSRADHSTTPVGPIEVNYLVVEAGLYDGFEAGTVVVDNPDRKGDWEGISITGEVGNYDAPIVVGQVLTANNTDRPVTFWARGTTPNDPPSSDAIFVGTHVGERPRGSMVPETVGYIIFESGQRSVGDIELVAGLGDDTIQGVDDNPPYTYEFTGLDDATFAVVSIAGMDGNDGGWTVLWGDDPVSNNGLQLAIAEENWRDDEQRHTTEQASYIVVDATGSFPILLGGGFGLIDQIREGFNPTALNWSRLFHGIADLEIAEEAIPAKPTRSESVGSSSTITLQEGESEDETTILPVSPFVFLPVEALPRTPELGVLSDDQVVRTPATIAEFLVVKARPQQLDDATSLAVPALENSNADEVTVLTKSQPPITDLVSLLASEQLEYFNIQKRIRSGHQA